MITENDTSTAPLRDAMELALAVVLERIQTLPKEDKDDLFELSKAYFQADADGNEEERNSARLAMQEILDQKNTTIVPMDRESAPGEELEKWVGSVSARIKDKRKAAGLSQEDLAEKSGLPQSHISRLENGAHSPTFATLEKIASALNIPVSEFDPCAP